MIAPAVMIKMVGVRAYIEMLRDLHVGLTLESKGKRLAEHAENYGLQRKPGPRWWPWWPLRESDKKLRARLKQRIECLPNMRRTDAK